VLDACVLAKKLHRNILLNLAAADCFRPIWSDTILTETVSAIDRMGGDGAKTRIALETSFQSALADPSYIHLVRNFQLKDENDRHVVAVALQEHADAICTDNDKDFGLSTIDVLTCDQFLTDTIDLAPVKALAALATMRRQVSSFADGLDFVKLMRQRGLIETAAYLSPYSERL